MNEFDDAAYAARDDVAVPEAQVGATDPDPVLAGAQNAPRKATFQERIDEMTRARREAERERDYWREQAQAYAEPDPDEGEEPLRALARQEVEQVIAERAAAQQAALIQQEWEGRQAQFAQAQPDYAEVFNRDWACSPAMAEAIRTAEEGPAIAYHLAQNPQLARDIYGLPPMAQAREMGRIEAALSRGQHFSHNAAVSNAPAPPPQARGAGARMRVSADTDDFASFDRAY